MKRFLDILANIFAYPVHLYDRLTDKKLSLVLGIVLVGAIDFLLPDVANVFKVIFTDRSTEDVGFNAVMAVVIILVLGIIDVVFIGVPLYDIFKYLKKKEAAMALELVGQLDLRKNDNEDDENPLLLLERTVVTEHNASAIKVMKVYIMSHFIIIPVTTLLYYTLTRGITTDSAPWMQNLSLIIFMAIFLWSAGVLSRGINVLFRFNALFRRLTFIIVFTWTFIFSMVFDMQIMNWLLKLFR